MLHLFYCLSELELRQKVPLEGLAHRFQAGFIVCDFFYSNHSGFFLDQWIALGFYIWN